MMRILLILISLFSLPSWGQDFFQLLSPVAPSTSIELEGFYLPNKEAEGSDRTQVFQRGGTFNQKIYDDKNDAVLVGARYNEFDLSSSDEFLRDYYNHQLSLTYKRTLPNELFRMLSISYGSASDRPFKHSRDNTLSATYIEKFNERWFGVVNYSNNRSFLNNIPIPGFFYVKEMTRDKAMVFGFPFFFWLRPLGDKWAFRYFGLLPWTHRLKIFYKAGFISPYFGYEEGPQSFFRHDRDTERNRVFWFDRKLMVGAEGSLTKNIRLDLSSGWAFDRQLFEAENFSEKKEHLRNIDPSWFLSLQVRITF